LYVANQWEDAALGFLTYSSDIKYFIWFYHQKLI
jgi:hypothetical protein